MRLPAALLTLGCALGPVLAQTFAPLVRPEHVGHPAAFDSVRRRLVMLGDDGTTWELDGSELLPRANLSGASTPPPRVEHAMAYDEARRHVLIFGGRSGFAALDETWVYDGNRWTQLAGGPPARVRAAMTWDSTRSRILMHGGRAGFTALVDTWEHDGSNWLQRTPATTPATAGETSSMTFDRQRGVAVLLVPSPTSIDRIWEWNGTDWIPQAGTGPVTNGGATLTFDRTRNRTVLAGGYSNDRIWEWNGASWSSTALPLPFRRTQPAGWFDPACGCVNILGGHEAVSSPVPIAIRRADRWQWNGQTLTPVQADPIGPRTTLSALIPDPLRGRVLLFGGQLPIGILSAATWALDRAGWSPVASPASPSARASAATTYDLIRGEGLLFGGNGGTTFWGDTWSFTGAGWIARSSSGPSRRESAAMATDLVRGVVVLFGGQSSPAGFIPHNDTWEWNGTVWSQRQTNVAPSARAGAGMAFHPQLGRILLFGGATQAGLINDTWTWDGAQWTELSPTTTPPPLFTVSLSSNLQTNTCILVGTESSAGSAARQQVWSHNGVSWAQIVDELAANGSTWSACVSGTSFDTVLCTRLGDLAAELTPFPGRVATLGAGCGTPASTLVARSRPRVGTTTGLELVANPGRAVLFALDLTSGNTPIGGGCTVWLGPGFLGLFQISDTSGFAAQPLSLPPNPTLRGLDLFGQAAVLEPLSSNGLVLTQGLRLTLGD